MNNRQEALEKQAEAQKRMDAARNTLAGLAWTPEQKAALVEFADARINSLTAHNPGRGGGPMSHAASFAADQWEQLRQEFRPGENR